MENLIKRAVGYLVLEADIPSLGLLAGDCVYIDDDRNTNARLFVAEWGGKAHICSITDFGGIFDYGSHNLAPAGAKVIGRALYVLRKICSGKEDAA